MLLICLVVIVAILFIIVRMTEDQVSQWLEQYHTMYCQVEVFNLALILVMALGLAIVIRQTVKQVMARYTSILGTVGS
jgi:mannose/fructose/N-acetylgalactosamine-specific phosphotransferase system component IIC